MNVDLGTSLKVSLGGLRRWQDVIKVDLQVHRV